MAQWKYGKNYMDRKEALDYFSKNSMTEMIKGLDDPFFKIKISAIQKLGSSSLKNDEKVLSAIEQLASTEKNKKVKAAAISFLVKTGDKKYLPIYETAINDSSYTVAGAAFKGINGLNPDNAYAVAKKYCVDAKGALGDEVNKILIANGTEADFDFVSKSYSEAPLSQEKIGMTNRFIDYLIKINDLRKVKAGIDNIAAVRNQIPSQYRSYVDNSFKGSLDKLIKAKGKELEDYINEAFK